ncbi:rhomboid family intramembrane serine protease [Carbonactinospora thermoautotrophica]|nr:rhomboid family intramembrane serine protease [Carbonactinospora thermoautotrophica]
MPEDGQGPNETTGPAGAATLVCYRHPDRETYIRCARCERPVCPECMISAAVGFQCPECVREGSREVRQARTVFGGAVQADTTVVTKILIVINVLVFGLVLIVGDPLVNRLMLLGKSGFVPGTWEPGGVAYGEWWRLVTAAFLHQQLFHVLVNMWALWVLGPTVEAWLGRLRFVVLYLLAALGGAAASYAFNPPTSGALGASGAIFGLMGALLVMARRLRYDLRGLLALLAINLAFPFLFAHIDWKAHLGGLVVGLALGAGYAYAPRGRQGLAHALAAGGVFLLCVAVVVARTLQLNG